MKYITLLLTLTFLVTTLAALPSDTTSYTKKPYIPKKIQRGLNGTVTNANKTEAPLSIVQKEDVMANHGGRVSNLKPSLIALGGFGAGVATTIVTQRMKMRRYVFVDRFMIDRSCVANLWLRREHHYFNWDIRVEYKKNERCGGKVYDVDTHTRSKEDALRLLKTLTPLSS